MQPKYFNEIWGKIMEQWEGMVKQHEKYLYVFVDVRFPQRRDLCQSNVEISDVSQEKLRPIGLDVPSIWVREPRGSDRNHYHGEVLLGASMPKKSL